MNDFRENYFEAREIVAKELIEKYNLTESTNEYDCLTLDSSNYSIHLTFIVPDGDEVYMSEKTKEWYTGKSFYSFMLEKYPDDEKRKSVTHELFKSMSNFDTYDYSVERLTRSFLIQIIFLINSNKNIY